jgi:hypothetical protein
MSIDTPKPQTYQDDRRAAGQSGEVLSGGVGSALRWT